MNITNCERCGVRMIAASHKVYEASGTWRYSSFCPPCKTTVDADSRKVLDAAKAAALTAATRCGAGCGSAIKINFVGSYFRSDDGTWIAFAACGNCINNFGGINRSGLYERVLLMLKAPA